MAAHDRLSAAKDNSGGALLQAGAVIVVDGKRWYRAADAGQNQRAGPRPMGVTTEVSCQYTCAVSCAPTTCGATICVGQTCRGTTCFTPSCIGATCTGPTCWGVSCSIPGDTCYFPTSCGQVTCNGGTTCNGAATCLGTCVPANCPTTLSDVQVPQPGVIQMVFMASSTLRYTLQWCTDVSAGHWVDVYSAVGNGGVMTVGHTNDAPRSFYRLWVQNLSGS